MLFTIYFDPSSQGKILFINKSITTVTKLMIVRKNIVCLAGTQLCVRKKQLMCINLCVHEKNEVFTFSLSTPRITFRRFIFQALF